MGAFQGSIDKRRFVLRSRSVVGRAHPSELKLDDPRVSAQHALVYWSGAGWVIKDLGSRNGTALNGRMLTPGVRENLKEGDRVAFGSLDLSFSLVDALAPIALATRSDSGEVIEAQDELLYLPARSGGPYIVAEEHGTWMLERGEQRSPVLDGDPVIVDDVTWVLTLPSATGMHEVTVTSHDYARLAEVTLEFLVSPDEEHVQLTLGLPRGRFKLPERACTYTLLQLARARLRDSEQGISEAEQGWIYADELEAALGKDATHLNVDVFRARKQLERAGVRDADRLVLRRPATRQLRLGVSAARVVLASSAGSNADAASSKLNAG